MKKKALIGVLIFGLLAGAIALVYFRPASQNLTNWLSLAVAAATGYLAWRQLRIMEVQDEILNRRISLKSIVVAASATLPSPSYSLVAHNTGRKNVSAFYWHVCVSQVPGMTPGLDGRGANSVTVGGEPMTLFKDYFRHPVFPTTRTIFGTLTLQNLPAGQPFRIGTRLVTEDGSFPEGENAFEFVQMMVDLISQ